VAAAVDHQDSISGQDSISRFKLAKQIDLLLLKSFYCCCCFPCLALRIGYKQFGFI
jgi:hypothetical protein